jgi:transposase
MHTVTTIGLDIAKSVFQVHGIDVAGQVVVRRQLKRRFVLSFFEKLPPCLVGIEACASSHHWSRELQALGHTVRLMPPAYVNPTSSGRRTTPRMRKRFAKRSRGPTCGSCRPKRSNNRAAAIATRRDPRRTANGNENFLAFLTTESGSDWSM